MPIETPQNLSLVDSHCHLDFPDFKDDFADVLARAESAGLQRMVTICTRLASEPNVRAIAEAHEPIYYAAGVHPMNVAEAELTSVDELIALTKHPKMVGIGETGLDYYYTEESKDKQQESLRIHIEAAQVTGLPLIIHARSADDDIAAILAEGYRSQPYGCVMHCFSSSEELALAALEMDFYLSMSGIAAFKKSDELRSIFAKAPVERILVETDAPYLAPPPYRGKRNEPSYVAHTATIGADVFGMTPTDFAAQTTENFYRLFSKTPRPEITNG